MPIERRRFEKSIFFDRSSMYVLIITLNSHTIHMPSTKKVKNQDVPKTRQQEKSKPKTKPAETKPVGPKVTEEEL